PPARTESGPALRQGRRGRALARGQSQSARAGDLPGGVLMLEVREIHTYYGDSHVLQGVSLSMSRGQVVGILGRNGMGKTTLIRSIIGFTVPRRVKVVFKDRDITAWTSQR